MNIGTIGHIGSLRSGSILGAAIALAAMMPRAYPDRFIGSAFTSDKDKFAFISSPWRVHKRRRNQTVAYHRRVQKKWLKRYGTTGEMLGW